MSIDEVSEHVARRLGNRQSRKGFLGRLGGALVAVGGTSAGLAPTAFGRIQGSCCGCAPCGYSTTCGTTCPGGTSPCGSWYMCECVGSRLAQYQDCCGGCGGGCSCGGDGKPSCYYDAPYQSGFQLVNCRAISCTQITC